MNLNMRASAVLLWLPEGENPTLETFGPKLVQPPPNPNPEPWWRLEDAIVFAQETHRDHEKVPWIKTGDAILAPDQISRAYSALGAARKF
jgi:hypothetical protein